MRIYFARHGQTNLNRARLMQGRTDEPLNETGRQQARMMREKLLKSDPELSFDAVYSSPLDRAKETACILGDVPREALRIDERIIEADFGKYEGRGYHRMGLAMTLYWAFPEVFPAPATVETISSMVARTSSFLEEIMHRKEETVLVVCHGGILRAVYGHMEGKKNGIIWRPKPRNCEIRVYDVKGGQRQLKEKLMADEE